MCFSQQPEPEINKPNYTPDQIDSQMKLTVKENGQTKTIPNGTPTATTDEQKLQDGPTTSNAAVQDAAPKRTSGIYMRR